MPADSDRIGKFIRMLGSSADAEVLKAARDLVSELKADGFDLHTLAAAWETERERQRGPRPTPLFCRPSIGLRWRRPSRATPTARPQ